MPPEIIDLIENIYKKDYIMNSIENIDLNKIDVFSLGVTIYSCIFLTYPFENNNVDENDPKYKLLMNKEYD